MKINASFEFFVDEVDEERPKLNFDQLKEIGNEFLSDVKDHLESELIAEHGPVNIHIETKSTSMVATHTFEISTSIRFTAAQVNDPGATSYLKERLTHWTKVIGDKLYQNHTESGHYISHVKIYYTAKCRDGFERSTKTKRCIKKCSSGTSRNRSSGRCKKDKKPCPPGSYRSQISGRCKKDASRNV
jgi:hypothetical protein